MARITRSPSIILASLTALSAPISRAIAQEGNGTIEAVPRHGYYFASRPHVALSIYCGFNGSTEQEVEVFQRSPGGDAWRLVGTCNSSHAKGSETITVAEATMHFIFTRHQGAVPAPTGELSEPATIIKEASNDCGIRLKYSDDSGHDIRLVLLDHAMAFGHGVPITKVCDPLLDHYDHF